MAAGAAVVESFIRCEGFARAGSLKMALALANFGNPVSAPAGFGHDGGAYAETAAQKAMCRWQVNAAGVLLPNDKLLTKAENLGVMRTTAAQLIVGQTPCCTDHHVKS